MITFRQVALSDADMILEWRTSPRVTEFMHSDLDYDLEAQKQWIQSCFEKPTYYHWIIRYNDNDVGLLNFIDWDRSKKTTSWGFYIGDESALGIGGMVPPYFYNFAFNVLCVDTITADVFYNNTSVIDLHLKQGYTFEPHRDYVIEKGGNSILIVCMSLKKSVFRSSRLHRLQQEFPISLWNANPTKSC